MAVKKEVAEIRGLNQEIRTLRQALEFYRDGIKSLLDGPTNTMNYIAPDAGRVAAEALDATIPASEGLRPAVLIVPGNAFSQGLPERILFFADHNDAWDAHHKLGVNNWMMAVEAYGPGEKPEFPTVQQPLFLMETDDG